MHVQTPPDESPVISGVPAGLSTETDSYSNYYFDIFITPQLHHSQDFLNKLVVSEIKIDYRNTSTRFISTRINLKKKKLIHFFQWSCDKCSVFIQR